MDLLTEMNVLVLVKEIARNTQVENALLKTLNIAILIVLVLSIGSVVLMENLMKTLAIDSVLWLKKLTVEDACD